MAAAMSGGHFRFDSNHMRTIAEVPFPGKEISRNLEMTARSVEKALWRLELAALAALIALLNLPLVTGHFAGAFAFLPAAVRAGEWWRLFTYSFVHVSWYHLLLDATAFFMAYAELRERRWLERLGLVAAAGAGGLLTAWWTAPVVFTQGLCGLSGIAHGLAAVVGLELGVQSGDRLLRRIGLASFAGVVLKSLVEAWTGEIVFTSWHLGWLGTPIAVCHAGGVIGASMIWLLLHTNRLRAFGAPTLGNPAMI
jgi:rhomboid family GlyGly-CTERM serine protease